MKKSNSPQMKLFDISSPENEPVLLPEDLHSFYYFLKSHEFSDSTSQEHIATVRRFKEWAKEEHYQGIEHMSYHDILKFVQYMRSNGIQPQTINVRLNSIRKYYEHLKEEGIIENNPAKRVYIRGTVKKIIVNPLPFQELELLYQEYSERKQNIPEGYQKDYLKRQVMLGFMIFQATHSGELMKLEKSHINLDNGSVYIPGSKRSNGRTLKLDSRQIIALHMYIIDMPTHSVYLFDKSGRYAANYLTNEMKGLNPVIKNAGHIRGSVILHWTKIFNKRQVQYMIGHRHISSTERYEVQELDSLIDSLGKHHPFG